MRTCLLLLALVSAGVGLSTLLIAAPPATAERIDKLIADLGSAKFEDRERASRELLALGKPALEALRKAARGGEPETQRRADELVKAMEGRLNNERSLTPTRVRWTFKNTPILDALMEIQKTTGFAIHYVDDPDRLKGRTITLDTGSTTFWQAFDLFCHAAGLVEGQSNRNINQPVLAIAGAPAPQQPAARPAAKPLAPNIVVGITGPYRHVNLIEGKPRNLPTDYVGSMRVRTLGAEMELHNAPPRQDKEVRVLLDLSPEPGVEFQRIVDLRIDRAVDERGQSLAALKTAGGNGKVPVNAAVATTNQRALLRQMPVRLEAAAQPSRMLKELKGIVMTMIRTPPQVMATVEDLLKASGKSVKGDHGVSITVKDVKQHNDGRVELQVTLERPVDVYGYIPTQATAPAAAPAGGGPIQIQPIQRPAGIQIKSVPIQVQPVPARPAPAAVPAQPVPPQAVPPQPAVPPAQQAPNPALPNALPIPAPQPGAPAQLLPAQGQQGVVGRPAVQAFIGLTVQDAKGQRLALEPRSQGQRSVKGIYTYEITLTVKPAAGQGEPAKLVFTGTRIVPVEVPFALKDVPLP